MLEQFSQIINVDKLIFMIEIKLKLKIAHKPKEASPPAYRLNGKRQTISDDGGDDDGNKNTKHY